MSKVSPGPWTMATSCSFRRILDARGREIIGGTIQQSDGHPDLHFANGGFEGPDARAVLAAPELLEALAGLLAECDKHGSFEHVAFSHPLVFPAFNAAREAIRKATGAKNERTVTIPACDEHEGHHVMTVTLPWVCLECGGPRGEPYDSVSYDGSRRAYVHSWVNPCGHVEKYSAVRAAIAKATGAV